MPTKRVCPCCRHSVTHLRGTEGKKLIKDERIGNETPLLKRVRFTPQSIIAAALFAAFNPGGSPDDFARMAGDIEHLVGEIMGFLFLPKTSKLRDLPERFPGVARGMRLLAETYPNGTDPDGV
jgi:hypothetical protein